MPNDPAAGANAGGPEGVAPPRRLATSFTIGIRERCFLRRKRTDDDVGAGPTTAIGGPAIFSLQQIERENHEQN